MRERTVARMRLEQGNINIRSKIGRRWIYDAEAVAFMPLGLRCLRLSHSILLLLLVWFRVVHKIN